MHFYFFSLFSLYKCPKLVVHLVLGLALDLGLEVAQRLDLPLVVLLPPPLVPLLPLVVPLPPPLVPPLPLVVPLQDVVPLPLVVPLPPPLVPPLPLVLPLPPLLVPPPLNVLKY
jgi:hypothetical protein